MECPGGGGMPLWSAHKRWLILDSLHMFSKWSLPLQYVVNPRMLILNDYTELAFNVDVMSFYVMWTSTIHIITYWRVC